MNEESRTPNQLIRNQLLYPIELHSYMAGAVGFEPTITVSETVALPLGYTPISNLVTPAGIEPAFPA